MSTQRGISSDVVAGALLLALGSFGAFEAFRYGVGSVTAMGPGFLPFSYSLILVACGVGIAAQRLVSVAIFDSVNWRGAAFVLGSIVAFGLVIEMAGLVPAIFVSVLVCGAAEPRVRWIELLLLSAGLAAFCSVVFVMLLGLNVELVAL